MIETPAMLEGYLSINAALYSGSRPIHRIAIHQSKQYDRHLSDLVKRARASNIPVDFVDDATIRTLTEGNTHGGVVATVGERQFVTLNDLIEAAKLAWVVMLDGIEDPYNFGYTVRALYAAGVAGIVVRPRNWLTAASVVGRASAGASERVKLAIAETAQDAADFYRTHGLTIVTTAREDRAVSLYAADLTVPLFLLIGGEKRGVTRSFMDKADLLLQIPYGRDFRQSLGTVAAASAIAFEIARQRSP